MGNPNMANLDPNSMQPAAPGQIIPTDPSRVCSCPGEQQVRITLDRLEGLTRELIQIREDLQPIQLSIGQFGPKPTQASFSQFGPHPTQMASGQASLHLTQMEQEQASPHPTQMAPGQASPHPTQMEPVQASPHPTQMEPVQASPHPTQMEPVQASPHPTQMAPGQASPHPTQMAPVQASPHPTQMEPVQASPHPTQEPPGHANPHLTQVPGRGPPVYFPGLPGSFCCGWSTPLKDNRGQDYCNCSDDYSNELLDETHSLGKMVMEYYKMRKNAPPPNILSYGMDPAMGPDQMNTFINEKLIPDLLAKMVQILYSIQA